jgi:hypothetical protein
MLVKSRKIKIGAVLGVSIEDTSQLFDPSAPFLHVRDSGSIIENCGG